MLYLFIYLKRFLNLQNYPSLILTYLSYKKSHHSSHERHSIPIKLPSHNRELGKFLNMKPWPTFMQPKKVRNLKTKKIKINMWQPTDTQPKKVKNFRGKTIYMWYKYTCNWKKWEPLETPPKKGDHKNLIIYIYIYRERERERFSNETINKIN